MKHIVLSYFSGGVMFAQENHQSVIRIPSALRLVGIIGGSWAILIILAAVLAYLPVCTR